MPWAAYITGLLFGLALSAPLTWWIATRLSRRARAAERRARNAERMAEIGAMTGGLAHEIKNPLSSIGLNAQLLSEAVEDLPVNEEDRTRLSRRIGALRREVERLRDILTDFLRFAGALRLERTPVDVREVIEELADFYTPQAEQAGVRVRIDLPDSPIPALLDAPHFKQALLNLMLNATQAMSSPSGSGPAPGSGPSNRDTNNAKELIVRAERVRAGMGADGACRVHVIDTGPGIPADRLEKIFTPYFTTKSGGSGLGLPVAKRIVQEHGGEIDVHTEPGRGTDFVITIPGAPN